MIIAIAGSKGGSGKTNLALNLAADMGVKKVIDLDPLAAFSMLNNLRGLGSRALFKVERPTTKEHLITLIHESEGERLIIDCGGFDSDLNRIAISAADLVLVPTNDDATEIKGALRLHEIMSEIAGKINRPINAHLVVTRINANRRDFSSFSELCDELPLFELAANTIPFSAIVRDATKRGLSASEFKKYSSPAKAHRKLINEIEGLLHG